MAGWPLPRVRTHFRASHKTCAVFSGLGKCSNGAEQSLGTPWSWSDPNPQDPGIVQAPATLHTEHLTLTQCHGDGQIVPFPLYFPCNCSF